MWEHKKSQMQVEGVWGLQLEVAAKYGWEDLFNGKAINAAPWQGAGLNRTVHCTGHVKLCCIYSPKPQESFAEPSS